MNSGAAKPILSAVVVLLVVITSAADDTPLAEFRSHILLNADSSAVVIENLRPATPGFLERRIRVHSNGTFGRDRLRVDILEVTDGNGRPLHYRARVRRNDLVVQCAAAGEVKLTYAVRNAIRYWGGHDEFVWPATPDNVPVNSAYVRVSLPPEAAGQFTSQAVLRRENEAIPVAAVWSSDGRVPLRPANTEIETGTPGPLAEGIVLLVDLVAEKGVFKPIPDSTRLWWFAENNPIVLLPVLVLAAMLVLRRMKTPNADPGRSVAPMYSPPEGLTPAEAGTLIDDALDPRDVTATLVDLAVRGFLRIEPCAPQEGLVSDRPDFIIRLLKPRDQWQGLAAHEETMLFHTFYGGQWTKLSSLRLRFPDIVPIIWRQVLNALRDKRMYRVDPVQAQKWRQAGLYVLSGALFAVQEFMGFTLFDSPWLGAAVIVVSAIIVFALGRQVTAKTLRGMRAYVALLGLQEFIGAVDADRLQRVDQAHLEKLLPYAIALGIEPRWAQAFHGIATATPEWFAGTDGHAFDPVAFGKLVGGLATAPALFGAPRGRIGSAGLTDTAARATTA